MPTQFTIGIDIGGTRLKAAVVDQSGVVSNEIVETSQITEPYPAVLHQIHSAIKQLMTLLNNRIDAVGIGVAGLVDADRRRVVAAPNCPGVVNVPLVDDLEGLTKCRVVLENDANAMAVGEWKHGAARGSSHLVALTLGTGIGGAVIIDGRVLRGWTGGGTELGHVCIDRRGPRCGCGSRGCLESYIGLVGIYRWVARHIPVLKEVPLVDISARAASGDCDAQAVFNYIGHILAVGVAGLINTFNPEVVVIGGGVSDAGRVLFEPLLQQLPRWAFASYLEDVKIAPAQLGNWAGVVGAANLAHELSKP